jgi:CheY-like chemotaxis protein
MDTNTQSQNSSKKILVVEDELYLRELYLDILKGEGYQVTDAADGEKAYEEITKGGYDLVLLDIMLPKMDGLTILKKIKDAPSSNPNKGIVMLTNLGHDSAISQAISLGARGYMIKSDYTPEELLKEVQHYLTENVQPSPVSNP